MEPTVRIVCEGCLRERGDRHGGLRIRERRDVLIADIRSAVRRADWGRTSRETRARAALRTRR